LAEGWKRLQALTEGRLLQREPAKQDPALLRQLDEWENRWFPVASASIKTRFPDVHAQLFLNLSQTDGPAVVISVGTFVQRLEKLPTDPGLGARGAEARELLSARGLNAATVETAKRLLDALGTTAPAEPIPAIDPAQQAAAEEAMWRWYLEWGEIARVAITDRKLLRELGFLNYKRPLAEEEPEELAPSVESAASD
jgi:hypothetical protein